VRIVALIAESRFRSGEAHIGRCISAACPADTRVTHAERPAKTHAQRGAGLRNQSIAIDKKMRKRVKSLGFGLIAAAAVGLAAAGFGAGQAAADDEKSPLPDPKLHAAAQDGKKWEAGRWVLPDGSPTYDVTRDEANTDIVKKVDWMTYSGWRRYHAECHVCHGPNAEGSTYAPALRDSLKTMDYAKFLQVVASGQERDVGGTKFIMPALGDNKNVMCYVDDLYVYLLARATDALPGGRISADQRADKPKEAIEAEKACIGD